MWQNSSKKAFTYCQIKQKSNLIILTKVKEYQGGLLSLTSTQGILVTGFTFAFCDRKKIPVPLQYKMHLYL